MATETAAATVAINNWFYYLFVCRVFVSKSERQKTAERKGESEILKIRFSSLVAASVTVCSRVIVVVVEGFNLSSMLQSHAGSAMELEAVVVVAVASII